MIATRPRRARTSTATLHVGIDATSWRNDRGFGRFTREIVTALAARDRGFRYTLLFDRRPETPVPDNVTVLSAQTRRTLTESAVGTMSRSVAYLWKMGRCALSENIVHTQRDSETGAPIGAVITVRVQPLCRS